MHHVYALTFAVIQFVYDAHIIRKTCLFALSEGSVWTVASATDFGAAWTVRTVLAAYPSLEAAGDAVYLAKPYERDAPLERSSEPRPAMPASKNELVR